mgnify:CR=1 FL=1
MIPPVVIVDDCEDLREMLAIALQLRLGIECQCYGSFREIAPKKALVKDAKVAILDVNLGAQEPSGIEVYHWLKEISFCGKVYFLTGHAKFHPLVQEAIASGAETFEKPLSSEKLISIVHSSLMH